MPYIQVRSNKEITKEKEIAIKKRLGDAITILGKSELWLMVEFVSNAHLYFKGNDNIDMAYVDVRLYGNRDSNDYNKFTLEICNILFDELKINADEIYVSYNEFSNWGYNGSNF